MTAPNSQKGDSFLSDGTDSKSPRIKIFRQYYDEEKAFMSGSSESDTCNEDQDDVEVVQPGADPNIDNGARGDTSPRERQKCYVDIWERVLPDNVQDEMTITSEGQADAPQPTERCVKQLEVDEMNVDDLNMLAETVIKHAESIGLDVQLEITIKETVATAEDVKAKANIECIGHISADELSEITSQNAEDIGADEEVEKILKHAEDVRAAKEVKTNMKRLKDVRAAKGVGKTLKHVEEVVAAEEVETIRKQSEDVGAVDEVMTIMKRADDTVENEEVAKRINNSKVAVTTAARSTKEQQDETRLAAPYGERAPGSSSTHFVRDYIPITPPPETEEELTLRVCKIIRAKLFQCFEFHLPITLEMMRETVRKEMNFECPRKMLYLAIRGGYYGKQDEILRRFRTPPPDSPPAKLDKPM